MSNEIIGCTCNLNVVRFGTQQQVHISYTTPQPIPNEGYTVIDYDKAPAIQPTRAVTGISQQKQGEEKVYLYEVRFSAPGMYFGYNAFESPLRSEVAYSSSDKFILAATVVLEYITVMDKNGNVTKLLNQTLSVSDLFVYRQPPMTGSWGSEEEQSLTIPWQDYR